MFVSLPLFNDEDMRILNKYAHAIFGREFDDLPDRQQKMLIAHARDREIDFQDRRSRRQI